MRVIKSEKTGYCFGVQKAVETAEDFSNADSGRVFSYGPLIHNKTVLKRLETGGITVIDKDKALQINLKGAFVIIRAHGVPPAVEKLLIEKGAFIKDATCPKVKANQLLAKGLENNGWTIFLAGDKHHAEIEGILGYAPSCICVKTIEDARIAAANIIKAKMSSSVLKTALIGQTTFSLLIYDEIGAELKKYFPEIEIKNTICPATSERQAALRSLCKKVDLVIIAGDKSSANTASLAALAKSEGVNALIVENVSEIPEIPKNVSVIGLASGASTPPEIIYEIEHWIASSL